jgi:hypothetical protein
MVTLIVGWIFILASWIVPYLIEDKQDRHLVGALLSVMACGIILGGFLHSLFG